MNMRFLLPLAGVLVFAGLDSPALCDGGKLPRYRLSVGQELTYETSSEFKAERSAMSEGVTGIFDVVSGDAQAGWHIVGRISSWNVQNKIRQESDSEMVAFDLKPDGAASALRGSNFSAAVPDVFPALPQDEAQLKGEWQRQMAYGAKIAYTSPTSAANAFTFKGEMIDPIYRIYLIKRQMTFQFDPARGMLESWSSNDSQGYGFVGKGTSRAMLKHVEVRPPQSMAQLSRDCDAYLDAQAQNTDASRAAMDDPAKCASLSKESTERLTAVRAQITTPELLAMLDKQIKALPARLEYFVQETHDRQR